MRTAMLSTIKHGVPDKFPFHGVLPFFFSVSVPTAIHRNDYKSQSVHKRDKFALFSALNKICPSVASAQLYCFIYSPWKAFTARMSPCKKR